MGRARKKEAPVQASSIDDAIRQAIIRDAIGRMALLTSAAQIANHRGNLQEPEPTVKRQKLDEAATVASGVEMQLPAWSTIVSQPEIEDHGPCVLPWPVEDFAGQLQSSTLEEFALSPLETEVIWLRAALAQSTEREESLTKMNKTLRIELHKAYRLIALQQLNNFTCDTGIPVFPGTQH
jgi:hypothetical protein